MTPQGDIGVYIHFPFCRARCPYCDFKVDVVRDIPQLRYRQAVLREFELRLTDELASRRLRSIYFGGGTPSLWAPAQVAAIVTRIAGAYRTDADDLEVTLEANPSSFSVPQLSDLVDAGINRVSMGVQSFDDQTLERLGRWHDGRMARQALDDALESGLAVSFDLICGAPGQSLAGWRSELAICRAYDAVDHVSVYELTIHEGTPFGRQRAAGRLDSVSEDLALGFWDATRAVMDETGRRHYEVSNYARPGHEAVHNGLYWSGAEYLGLGVSAHSMTLYPDRVVRRENSRHTRDYLTSPGEGSSHENLSGETHLRERLFLGLRTADGVDVVALQAQLGVALPEDVRAGLDDAVERGLLTRAGDWLRPSAKGLALADDLALELV